MTGPYDRPRYPSEQYPYGQQPPPSPRSRNGLRAGLIAGAVVVAVVAAVAVYLSVGNDQQAGTGGGSAGTPTSGAGAPDGPRDGEVHALEEINRQRLEARPKEEGMPSGADPELIRIGQDAIYTMSYTEKGIYLTSFGLEKNEIRWAQAYPVKNDGSIFMVDYTVVDGAVVIEVEFTNRAVYTKIVDPGTGEELWSGPFKPGCSAGCVYGGQLVRTDWEAGEQQALDVHTGAKVWAVPERSDEPPFTWIRQQTAESMNSPNAAQGFTEKYVGHGQKATGLTRIVDTETGAIVSEGVVGDKVMDYLMIGEVLYVYRQTPADLTAYSVKDLSAPLWTVQVPAVQDGSALVSCHDEVLCLILLDGSGQTLRGVEMASGKTLWETRDYQSLSRTELRYVGGPVMFQSGETTVVFDAVTGAPIEQLASKYFFYLGAGVALVWEGADVVAFDVAGRKRLDLGTALGTDVAPEQCAWDEAYAACGHEEDDEFSLWRYRG